MISSFIFYGVSYQLALPVYVNIIETLDLEYIRAPILSQLNKWRHINYSKWPIYKY
jgi:hypothetical protein